MRFSTRSEYGLRAMINLARHGDKKVYPLSFIAQEEGISLDYLEKLLAVLRKKKLVESVRGIKGGYRLGKKPSSISLGDIIRALEGPIAPLGCVSERNPTRCAKMKTCLSREVWKKVRDQIISALDSMTLKDLIKETK